MVDFVAAVPIETKTASRELTIVVVEATSSISRSKRLNEGGESGCKLIMIS